MSDNIGAFTSSTNWQPAVTGTASGSNGVHGITTSDKDSAIYGEHGGDGIGVFGRGGEDAGEGVFGQTASAAAGVFGRNTSSGPGVFGSSDNGVGVVGQSISGEFAMLAEGDTSQSLDAGGWIKTLVQVAGGTQPKVQRFYSSEPGASEPVIYRLDAGLYSLDFGIDVSGRYVSVTPIVPNYFKAGDTNFPENPYAPYWYPPASVNPYQVNLIVPNIVFDGLTGVPTPALGDPGLRQPNKSMITVMLFQPAALQSSGASALTGFKLSDASFTLAIF
jgi:hypothetical protein